MSIRLVFFLVFLLPTSLFAQTKQDTVQLKTYQEINKKFPLASLVNLQYEVYTPSKIKVTENGRDFLKTDLNSHQRLSSSFIMPVFMSKKLIVLSSFSQYYDMMSFHNIDSMSYVPANQFNLKSYNSFSFSDALNILYFGKIFRRSFICNLIPTIEFSQNGYERTYFKGILSVNLKENKRTSFSTGLMVTSDPASVTPVIPVYSLTHWLSSKWLLDCFIPAYLYFRRPFQNDSRLSLGVSMMGGGQVFVHPDISSASSFTLNSGRLDVSAMYQKLVGRGLTLTTKIGYPLYLDGKLIETNKGDVVFKTTQKANFNINIGLSYTPAFKKKH